MEAGHPHAALTPRRQVPAPIILCGYPPSQGETEGFDTSLLAVDCGAAWGLGQVCKGCVMDRNDSRASIAAYPPAC
jgi:hypothetical protein